MKTPLRSRLVSFALIASVTLQVDSCGGEKDFGFEEQEFLCDEADAKLAQCCERPPRLSCTRQYGCNYQGPELSEEDAMCIRDSSCAALRAAGACALKSWRQGGGSLDGGLPLTTSAVLQALRCP